MQNFLVIRPVRILKGYFALTGKPAFKAGAWIRQLGVMNFTTVTYSPIIEDDSAHQSSGHWSALGLLLVTSTSAIHIPLTTKWNTARLNGRYTGWVNKNRQCNRSR